MTLEETKQKELLIELIFSAGTFYPLETLINGNITECIKTLKLMAHFYPIAFHENLEAIKLNKYTCNKYNYILHKININY